VVDFYGFHVGKYTSPDGMGIAESHQLDTNFHNNFTATNPLPRSAKTPSSGLHMIENGEISGGFMV